MTRYCSQCGRPSEDNISFCPDCGTELDKPIMERKPSKNNEIIILQIGTLIMSIGTPLIGLILSLVLYSTIKNSMNKPNKDKYLKACITSLLVAIVFLIIHLYFYISI